MRESLLPRLMCPACGGAFALRARSHEGGHILDGTLDCTECGNDYAVRGGVPRLLSFPDLSPEKKATAESFGYAWKAFHSLTPDYEEQFLSWIEPVDREFFKGKLVLEAGCGKGRHSFLSALFGAKEVISVDISEAVEVAFANTKHLENVHIVQADIYNLPLRPEFDYAFSVGVLHHLPDPEGGFRKLVEKVKPGGTISAWVYGRENNGWIIYGVNPVRENLTSRMRLPVLQKLAGLIAAPLYAYARGVVLPAKKIGNGLHKKLFYAPYMAHIGQFSFREVHSIVLDHLIAPTAFYLRKEEFAAWFERAGLEDTRISWRLKNSWRGCGRRPD